MNVRERFIALCREAKEADTGSVTDFEPIVIRLVEFCRSQERADVDACILSLGKGEIDAPYEMLGYLAHVFRPSSIVRDLQEFHRTLDPRTRRSHDFYQVVADVIDASEDDWPDRDLWSSLGRS